MLASLTRIIGDRSVGSLFFGNYHLMDFELMGGDARAAIIAKTPNAERRRSCPRSFRGAQSSGRCWSQLGPGPLPLPICHETLDRRDRSAERRGRRCDTSLRRSAA